MASRFCRNPSCFAGYIDPNEFEDFMQGTFMPSNTGPLNAPILDVLISAPAPAKYTKDTF